MKLSKLLLLMPLLFVSTLSSCKKNEINEYQKVFLLFGQSNATGISDCSLLASSIGDEHAKEIKRGFSNVQISYECDGGRNASYVFTKVKSGQGVTRSHFGPELGFAEKMSPKFEKETIYIIKYSISGSCLASQWFDGEGNRGIYYNSMKTFVEGRLDLLDNPKICGMMWMQGESDASEYSSQYLDNTRKFVSYVREDFSSFASSNGISFVDAGISTVWTNYFVINDTKKAYSLEDSNSCYFDTIEAGLHTNMEPNGNPDIAHYDSDSMVKLGNLFAENMLKVTNF